MALDFSDIAQPVTKPKTAPSSSGTLDFSDVARPLGLITPGTFDPMTRPKIQNANGTYSTLRTITVEEDGKTILLPTAINGRIVSPQEAFQWYRRTGQHLGIFDNEQNAQAYDRQLHNQIEPGSYERGEQGTAPTLAGWLGNLPGIKQVGDVYRQTLGAPQPMTATTPMSRHLAALAGLIVDEAGNVYRSDGTPVTQTQADLLLGGAIPSGGPAVRGAQRLVQAAPKIAPGGLIGETQPVRQAVEQGVGRLTGMPVSPAVSAAQSASETAQAARQGVPLLPQVGARMSEGPTMAASPPKIPMIQPPGSVLVSPVQRVLEALKEAGPVRAEQEALYSAERSKRLGAALSIGERVPGQAGFRQQLGALKGELPKAEFAPLQINQPDIDALFNQIESNPLLSGFNKINAKVGLQKLFGVAGGQVPTDSELSLLGRVFGNDFVSAVMAKRPMLSRVQNAMALAGGVMKSLSASTDLSAPFRQGVFAAARFAPEFVQNFAPMVRAFASEGAYQGIAKDIASRPTFELMERGRLALTALSDTALTTGEEQYMASKIAERIPVLGRIVRGSDRAFSGFLTKFRADIFDSMIRDAKTMGVDLNDIQLQRIAGFINTATGRGNLGSLAPAANALSTVLFSPRLIASRIQLLNPAYYVTLDPFTRRYALQSAAAFYGTISTVLGLAAMAGARVGTDVRSADFGKIRVGNTRFEITGGFQPYLRLLGQLYAGQAISTVTGLPETIRGQPLTRKDMVQRFIEGKFAPLASTARDVLAGSQFGQPITVQQQIVSRFVPLVLQDLYDIASQEGPQALGRIIPGIFGVGVQTYGPPKNVSP